MKRRRNRRRIKKLLLSSVCIIIVAILAGVLLNIWRTKASKEAIKQVTSQELPERYVEEVEKIESLPHQYGESESYVLMEGPMMTHIVYPVGSITEMNDAIKQWIQTKIEILQSKIGNQEENSSELMAEYASYFVEKDWVGVKLVGSFSHPSLAHPVDIVGTFNANQKSQKLLALDELLLDGGKEHLITAIAKEAGIPQEEVTESVLEHWVLTDQGLEIILERGKFLPMSEGTKTILLPYESLKGYLELKEEEKKVQADKPKIALTFDDGPSRHTERLLDQFQKNGGKATFFVLGNMIDNHSETLKRVAKEGHEIGGHSWNHAQLTKISEGEVKEQLMNTRTKIYQTTGVDTKIMRPPYGSFDDQVKMTAKEMGISIVNWSVDTLDWKHRDSDYVYQSIMDQAEDGAIILCHDLHETTVEAMTRAIPKLIEEGYELVTVSELLTEDGGTLEAGKVYFKQ